MGKRLLEFEEELIDVREIKQISKGFRWNKKEGKMEWTIEINSKIPESKIPIPVYIFNFSSEEFRDNKYEMLRMALEDLDDIEIIVAT